MAQTDILNPTPTHPLNPDYGFQKKRPLTHLNAKANQGSPYFREITDTGHQFVLSWNDKLATHARKLKWYYEQYRDGFFTIVDHEACGRHYVGRFSQPVEPIPTSHNHWSVQQVLFDEVPLAPMLIYPNDWNNDAIWRLLLNDFGDRMAAAVSGTWTLGANALAKSEYLFTDAGTVTTDQCSYVYAGYGFQFWAPTGPACGQATVLLDGTAVGTIDFYSAAAAASSMLLQVQNVSLGIHTVSLLPLNTKNAASSGMTVWWDALKVMR
ncbi:MAG: hypothetical protein ACLQG3_14700 [Terracidiphilus sp.]